MKQKKIVTKIAFDELSDFTVYTQRNLHKIPQLKSLSKELRLGIDIVSRVFPFRVNNYVLQELIDWHNPCADPMFKLVFPQIEMLNNTDFSSLVDCVRGEDSMRLQAEVKRIRQSLNPHPASQMTLNVPTVAAKKLSGIQHKYPETVLFFPSQGQVCHSYCTFCFRWAQFVGDKDLQFACKDSEVLKNYLLHHPEVSDVLFTGGDPMVMKANKLSEYMNALCAPELAHIQNIRIGTKSLTFWPQRFVTDADAPELLGLLARLVKNGKHVAIMSHYNHWRELDTSMAREAIRLIRDTGAEIRSQGPVLKHINDDAQVWSRLWKSQVQLGIIPYYMFIERDTGARNYFEVPLARAWSIFHTAMTQCSGLARTARGPSMSADPGKINIEGITEIAGEKVFVLKFLQSRQPDWSYRPFFARYDEQATWYDQLQPAFGDSEFFYSQDFAALKHA